MTVDRSEEIRRLLPPGEWAPWVIQALARLRQIWDEPWDLAEIGRRASRDRQAQEAEGTA